MTARHISDEIPRMLTGEADRDTVLSAAAHLRECVDCQQELVSALVAHASLGSAQRFAPEVVSGNLTDNLTDSLGDSTTGRLTDAGPAAVPSVARFPGVHRAGETVSAPARPDVGDTGSALPDLSALFAQVRAEATGTQSPDRTGGRRTRYLAVAAAAAVVVGAGGVVFGVTSGSHDGGGSPVAGRSVQLAAYDKGTTSATARVANSTMTIDATSLPKLTGKRYEVWLTNSKRTALQPIGWIGANGKATLTVPTDLMTKYSDLEVSVQDLSSSDYDYSGVSVLRGSLS